MDSGGSNDKQDGKYISPEQFAEDRLLAEHLASGQVMRPHHTSADMRNSKFCWNAPNLLRTYYAAATNV